jgi:hypothetical protein
MVYTIPDLIVRIRAWIKTNYNQDITGSLMQSILVDVVDSLYAISPDSYDDAWIISALQTKINLADIVDTLTSDDPLKPLSAKQGKALKTLLDGLTALGAFGGDFDASAGLLPTHGLEITDPIVAGMFWRVSTGGTITDLLPDPVLAPGDIIYAKVDGANDAADFFSAEGNQDYAEMLSRLTDVESDIATLQTNKLNISDVIDTLVSTEAGKALSANMGRALKALIDAKPDALAYTPENVANKATSLTAPNDTKYPSVKAVSDALTQTVTDIRDGVPTDGNTLGKLYSKFNNPTVVANFVIANFSNNQLTVIHNLNTLTPSVDIFDSANNHYGEINYSWAALSVNSIRISVPEAFDGKCKVTKGSVMESVQPSAIDSAIVTHNATTVKLELEAQALAISGKQTSLGFTPENTANKGQANGYAGLDAGGKVPSAQLPSFVDDVLEFANLAAFPVTGESGKIYVAINNGNDIRQYRWGGSAYTEILPSPGTTDSVTEGATNKYWTNARTLASVLTGFASQTWANITATDTVLSALQKIQGYLATLSDLFAGKKTYHGVVNPNSISFSVNNGTRTLTVVSGGSYEIFINGVKYTVSSDLSVQIGTGLGQHFVWFAISGGNVVLATSQTMWDILNTTYTPCATVHWDGATMIPGDELHDYRRNLLEHKNQHDSWGAQYVSGFTASPTFSAANTFSFAGGVIRDEERYHTLNGTLTQCRIGYRVTGGASMTFQATGAEFVKASAGVPQYDNNGTLTPITNNNYGIAWVYATNRAEASKLVAIVGQGNYATVAAAQAAAMPTLAGISVAEWKLLYRVIIKRSGSAFSVTQTDVLYNTSTGPAIGGGGASVTSAGNVTFSPAGNVAANNVQTAIEELDTEKAPQATTYTKTEVDNAVNAALGGQQSFSAIYAYQNFI